MSRKTKKNSATPMDLVGSIVFFLIGLLVFLPTSPLIGIVICAVTGKNVLNTLSQLDLTDGDEFRAAPAKKGRSVHQNAAQRIPTRVRTDEKKERPHVYDPMTYSYDTCAREKRMEQLKVLRNAGLLDDVEYRQRREQIEKMR